MFKSAIREFSIALSLIPKMIKHCLILFEIVISLEIDLASSTRAISEYKGLSDFIILLSFFS